MKNISA